MSDVLVFGGGRGPADGEFPVDEARHISRDSRSADVISGAAATVATGAGICHNDIDVINISESHPSEGSRYDGGDPLGS